MTVFRRLVLGFTLGIGVLVVVLNVSGFLLFHRPHSDALVKADAIVVLGGDHDGREKYGLELARQGYANTVLLSDPYPSDDPLMNRVCSVPPPGVTVKCFRPDPSTTRGEAMFAAEMAQEHNWKHVIVVSWNFHTVRARFIFHQCYDGDATFVPVPRSYSSSVAYWQFVYAYQFGALAKAELLGCRHVGVR